MVVPKRVGIDMTEYKNEVITIQGGVCAVTLHDVAPADGEIIWINGTDYFISYVGLAFLKKRFGESWIDERIVDADSYKDEQTDVYYSED
jgi:hypothetical protein